MREEVRQYFKLDINLGPFDFEESIYFRNEECRKHFYETMFIHNVSDYYYPDKPIPSFISFNPQTYVLSVNPVKDEDRGDYTFNYYMKGRYHNYVYVSQRFSITVLKNEY